jgi:hypothetical protein
MRFPGNPLYLSRLNLQAVSGLIYSFVKSQAGYLIRAKGKIGQKNRPGNIYVCVRVVLGHSIVFRQTESVVFGSERGASFQLFYRIFCFSKIGSFHIFGFPASCQKCAEKILQNGYRFNTVYASNFSKREPLMQK